MTKEQIRLIVQLQLERVQRTARGQGIELKFTDASLDRLADVGCIPEFGARELKRKIQTEIETPLPEKSCRAITEGDAILVDFEKQNNKKKFTEQ